VIDVSGNSDSQPDTSSNTRQRSHRCNTCFIVVIITQVYYIIIVITQVCYIYCHYTGVLPDHSHHYHTGVLCLLPDHCCLQYGCSTSWYGMVW